LNAPISAADAENLADSLKAMGASPAQLNSLGNLLATTEGKMSLNDFAGFFDQMGPGKDVSVGAKELDLIKNILAGISRERELAKTPVFNEILTKIQALGDQEMDEEFTKLSPALQALRGGVSAESAESVSGVREEPEGRNEQRGSGDQRGQNNQYDPMGRNGQEQSGQQREREARDQYRQAAQAAVTGADAAGSGIQTSETAQSYGYGGQESVARQISQKILYSHNRGLHRLRMKLNPESLGGLDIELKVKDGELTAHIKAESRETYMALADEVGALKEALAEGGVKLSNMTLAFDDEESGRREFADLGMRGKRGAASGEESDPAVIGEAAQRAAHDGLLSRVI
jgi:flagellar hook-length control protein FliK